MYLIGTLQYKQQTPSLLNSLFLAASLLNHAGFILGALPVAVIVHSAAF
jgi:hypothetical protein